MVPVSVGVVGPASGSFVEPYPIDSKTVLAEELLGFVVEVLGHVLGRRILPGGHDEQILPTEDLSGRVYV